MTSHAKVYQAMPVGPHMAEPLHYLARRKICYHVEATLRTSLEEERSLHFPNWYQHG